MDNSKPTNEQWAALYETAAAFKQTAPWDWMADSDIFGVQDPDTGKVGYCCVLGTLGQVLGLNVYLGAEGLDTYLKIQTGEMIQDDPDMLYSQDALVAHWEDRSALAPEDLQVIRNLGLKFKGKKAWPWFRRFEPGFPLEQLEGVPREIRVKKISLLQLLQPITDHLNIPIALQKGLPNLEEARWSMIEFLSRK